MRVGETQASEPALGFISVWRTFLGFLGGTGHRIEDVGIAGATAEVAIERMGDFITAWRWIGFQERDPGQDHPGRAKSALQTVAFPKSFLNGVELALGGESLDGRDFSAIRLECQDGARFDRDTVEQHRACAAEGGFAADMSAGELAFLAQEIDEQKARLDCFLA